MIRPMFPLFDAALPPGDALSLFPMLGILGGLLMLLALGLLAAIVAVVLILVAYDRKKKKEAENAAERNGEK